MEILQAIHESNAAGIIGLALLVAGLVRILITIPQNKDKHE